MSKFYYLTFSESSNMFFSLKEGSKNFHVFEFSSTHSKTIDWLEGSIKRSSYELGSISTLPSGDKYRVSVKADVKEPNDIYAIQKLKWWFLSKLGQLGWETFAIEKPDPPLEIPFDTSSKESYHSSNLGIIHFRKLEDPVESIEKKPEKK
jgi:hypothetical protein